MLLTVPPELTDQAHMVRRKTPLFSVKSRRLNAAAALKQRISYVLIVLIERRPLFLKTTFTRLKQS